MVGLSLVLDEEPATSRMDSVNHMSDHGMGRPAGPERSGREGVSGHQESAQ